MFTKKSDADYRELVDGVEMKTLAHGEKTLLAKFHLKKLGHAICSVEDVSERCMEKFCN